MALFSSSRSGSTAFNDPRFPRRTAEWATPPEPPFWRRPAGAVLVIAAIVVLLGLAAYALSPWLASRGIRLFGPSVVATYSTERGKTESITLKDGTTIVIGPLSSLEVFEGEQQVLLRGVGVFSVTPNPNRNFIVNANSTITVLGTDSAPANTQFAVRQDTAISIGVIEGRIRLGEVVILNTGNVADVASDGRTVITFERPMGPYRAWMNGNLEFVETPLSIVASDLMRWFDVDVQIADTALRQDTVTATFPIDSLSTAIRAVSQGARVNAKTVGRTITFSRPRAKGD